MEAFCNKPLLVRGWNINFRSTKNFPREKKLLNISFLNVSSEAPDEHLTDFLNQYVDIVGTPLHIKKNHGIYCMTGTRDYRSLHQHIPQIQHKMFGRTLLCIYDDQPINQQKKTKTTYTNQTPSYTDTEDEYSTQSENDDENQDSRSPVQKTATKPDQKQTRNYRSITDNQKNITKKIQQTNITTRKARTNATKPEYKIGNPTPTLDNNNFPQLPKQTEKEDDQQQQKTTDNQKTQMSLQTMVISETRPEDMPDITAIPETDLEAMPQTQTPEILSPSVVTNKRFQALQKHEAPHLK